MTTPTRLTALALHDDPRSVSAARTWVHEFLDRRGVLRPCIDDAVLVVSELASNAVRHGSGTVVCEALMLDRHRCLVSVVDFGPGEPEVLDRAIDEVGGLGMVIVDRLTLEWGVAPFPGGKAVYAVVDARTDADSMRERADAAA